MSETCGDDCRPACYGTGVAGRARSYAGRAPRWSVGLAGPGSSDADPPRAVRVGAAVGAGANRPKAIITSSRSSFATGWTTTWRCWRYRVRVADDVQPAAESTIAAGRASSRPRLAGCRLGRAGMVLWVPPQLVCDSRRETLEIGGHSHIRTQQIARAVGRNCRNSTPGNEMRNRTTAIAVCYGGMGPVFHRT